MDLVDRASNAVPPTAEVASSATPLVFMSAKDRVRFVWMLSKPVCEEGLVPPTNLLVIGLKGSGGVAAVWMDCVDCGCRVESPSVTVRRRVAPSPTVSSRTRLRSHHSVWSHADRLH